MFRWVVAVPTLYTDCSEADLLPVDLLKHVWSAIRETVFVLQAQTQYMTEHLYLRQTLLSHTSSKLATNRPPSLQDPPSTNPSILSHPVPIPLPTNPTPSLQPGYARQANQHKLPIPILRVSSTDKPPHRPAMPSCAQQKIITKHGLAYN